jgi:hypothetical protein
MSRPQGQHSRGLGRVQALHLNLSSSQTRFFARVDAEIEFFPEATGAVDHLVLYQGGHEMKGLKQPAQ